MIDHLSTYAIDYDKTKSFYLHCFSALGYELQEEYTANWNQDFPTQQMCAFGTKNNPIFWVIEVKKAFTPRHIAFNAKNRLEVDQFYESGIANNGICNGQPGLRTVYHPNYYGAFLLDPDGNNIEAVCHKLA